MKKIPALGSLVALFLASAPAATRAEPPPPNFAQAVVASLKIGPGIQSDQVILFPIFIETPPAPPLVQPSTKGLVTYAEPAKPKSKDSVEVFNATNTAVLVLGGTVLEGGKRDRMIVADHVLPPGATVEVEALPSSTRKGTRKEAIPFRQLVPLAPPYLREEAQGEAARTLVPAFVSHFLEFRNDGDMRESFAAISQTDQLAKFCLVCQRTMDKWPNAIQGATVVGGVSVIRGRVQALEVFGGNALVAAYFEPILRSLAFPAAAVELRAKKAGIPIPGKDVPEKTLEKATTAANELFAKLKAATYAADKGPEGEQAEAFKLAMSDGIKGRVVGREGKLVHLSVFPNDPFEYGLYSQPLNPIEAEDISSDPTRAGLEELSRREGLGARLTEAEKRLLDRLRGH